MSVEISTVAVSHVSNVAKSAPIARETGAAGQGATEVQQAISEKVVKSALANAETVSKTEDVSVEALKAAVVAGNAFLNSTNRNLQFQIDSDTKKVIVRIVDSKTGELVRQIPTVEMLDFIRHMKELEGNSGSILKGEA